MQINIFPHLSASKSMKRYFDGLHTALRKEVSCRIINPVDTQKKMTSFKKYVGYLMMAFSVKSGVNIILSERFSFLLLALRPKKSIVVCHDMVTLMKPHSPKIYKLWYILLLRFMKRAKYVVCISNNTKKDLLRLAPFIGDQQVKVIYNGLEKFWFEPLSFSDKYPSINYSFFLMVGTDTYNKNFRYVLEALNQLKSEKPSIRIIKVGEINNANRHYIGDNKIDYLIQHELSVSDEYLKYLYHSADALLFPSLIEGFGWPPAEAMACACPVIASRAPSIVEVCGDTAYYIDTMDVTTLVSAMRLFYQNKELRQQYTKKTKEQAANFSWERTSQSFINLASQLE